MARKLSLLLALALLLSCMPPAAAEETPSVNITATDINPLYRDVLTGDMLAHPRDTATPSRQTVRSIFHQEYQNAVAAVRSGMEARESQISVGYAAGRSLTQDESKAMCRDLVYSAMAHTGVPTQGDYLLCHYGGYRASISWDYANNYQFTYTFTYHSSAEQEAQMDVTVDQVLASLDFGRGTDYEKVKAIHDYICANVVYDYTNLNDPDYMLKYSAYAALINGTSVCQGYANLFYRMALTVGIDCRIISGISTQTGGGHAWNIVRLGNLYYNLDATWDAGQTEYDYFLTCPADFKLHQPDAEFTGDFDTLYPMATASYVPPVHGVVASGSCGAQGNNLTWELDDSGILTISGTGEMANFTQTAPWYDYVQQINAVVLQPGVTSIGSSAFSECQYLTSVSIPEGVRSIGNYVFLGCSNLRTLTIPASVTSVQDGSFSDTNLRDIYYGGTEAKWNSSVLSQVPQFANATVHFPDYIRGDVNGDGEVTDADAIHLLFHVLMPSAYPVTVDVDYNADGIVTDADAIYLLFHVLMPDFYPL